MTANGLTNAVIYFLKAKGYHVWRQNNMGVFDGTAATKRITEAIVIAQLSTGLTKAKVGAIVKRIIQSSWRKSPGSQRGVPDVIGFHKTTGTWIGVEVKIGRDRLSESQRSFLRGLNESGGEGFVARDYDAFQNAWAAAQDEKLKAYRKTQAQKRA